MRGLAVVVLTFRNLIMNLVRCLDAATIEKKRCKISDRDKGGNINKDKERSVNIFNRAPR